MNTPFGTMRRTAGLGRVMGALCLMAALVGWAAPAQAQPTLRYKTDQRGDFVLIGNTLGYACASGAPANILGIVGSCGAFTGDTSPDIFWRADAPTNGTATANVAISAAEARSTAVLSLPAGATVTYARLYWGGARSGATNDQQVLIERIGTGAFMTMATADASTNVTANTPAHTYYQSTADITSLVQARGPGAYRISGVDSTEIRNVNDPNLYVGWSMIVLYRLDSQPPRNLAIFDGLDFVNNTKPNISVALSGFVVPNAGFDAKLGVIAYEGDDQIDGDALSFNTQVLSNALNPADNFFNGTRTRLGMAVSTVGDLPQLPGTARSLAGMDLDVIEVTGLLKQGDTSATIQASSTGDFVMIGGFVTSISTLRPDLSNTSKTYTNLTSRPGNAIRPGDTIEYTITTRNDGTDTGLPVVLRDPLPAGLTFVPGSIRVTAGANAGTKTDVAGDDQAEYVAGTRTLIVRLGTGANATIGGNLAVGETTTVVFRATVDMNATGPIANQAIISAAGQSGAPNADYPSDGNGVDPGVPPTSFPIDQCVMDGDCMAPRPFCLNTAHPYRCVECRASMDCPMDRPVCDTATNTCKRCTSDANCGGATPFCDVPSATCIGCRTSADCGGLTPVCSPTSKTCVPCMADGAPDCPDPRFPACQKTGPLAGSCTECSGTNSARCGGPKPICLTDLGFCGCTNRDGDSECGGMMSGVICNGPAGICTPGCSTAPTRNQCPTGQACSSTDGTVGACVIPTCNNDNGCMAPRPRCDTAAMPRTCVQCLADADCPSSLICDTAAKRCVECTSMRTQNCVAPAAGTACLMDGTCGCTTDANCGTSNSGRVCDATLTKCAPGCRGTGGNGCPAGLICTSRDASIGRCVTPGEADAGAPDGGAVDAGGRDAAGDALGTDAPVADGGRDAAVLDGGARDGGVAGDGGNGDGSSQVGVDGYLAGGGCNCHVGAGSTGRVPAPVWVLVLGALILMRRRRR